MLSTSSCPAENPDLYFGLRSFLKDQLTVIETKINTLIKYSLKTKISPTSLTQVYLDAERFHNPLMELTKKLEFWPVLPVFFNQISTDSIIILD